MPEPIEVAVRKSSGRAVLISATAAIGGFLFGFDTAVINGAVDAVQDKFGLSSFLTGLMVAVALLGSALGAWHAGKVANTWGRIRGMVFGACLFFASSLGSGLAFSVWDFIWWRFVGGVGIGVASVIAPAYIAEIAPAQIRGRLGSLQQLAIVGGIFVALLSDAFIAHAAGGAAQPLFLGLPAWRWMFLVGVVPSIAYGILALQIPESPRYLVARGNFARAAEVLRSVVGLTSPESKVEEIRNSLQRTERPSFADLKGPAFGLQPIVWAGILLSVFQQFVGINVIFYYSTSLWRSVGFSETRSFSISVFTSVVNVLVTLIAISLVDRVGRRPLLLVGSGGMALTLGAMAWSFANSAVVDGQPELPAPWGLIALVSANLYVVFFGATWGPVVWVLLGEMFPNRLRAAALAVAAAAQWVANFLITTSFPVIAEELSLSAAYALYAASALASFVFVWKRIGETRGVELEDMTEHGTGPRRRRVPA